MRIITLLLFSGFLQLSAATYSQTVTIQGTGLSLKTVIHTIRKQVGYEVLVPVSALEEIKQININAHSMPLEDFLKEILKDQPLNYRLIGKTIILERKPGNSGAVRARNRSPQNNPMPILQKVISGSVTDGSGKAIEGVTVRVKDSGVTAFTDQAGNYRITLSSQDGILQFSMLGFSSQEVRVTNQTYVDIILEERISEMDEVVVVGYGTQKKVNLTGAVSVIKGDELANRPVGQTSAALQGMVPGLTVRQQSGQPGRDAGNLLIRGVGTIGDGMGPMVLVDGVETSINNVDPNEIEGISVLKDASSAAIYGSRAAGGVILVTTKRASKAGINVDYNTYGGWQVPTDMTDMVDGLDHMNLINEAYTNTGRSPLYSEAQINEYSAGRLTNPDKYPDTDWEKLTMKKSGFMQSHHIGLSSATENVKILASLGYMDQDGIIANTNFKRYNFRVNSDVKLNDKLNAALDLFLLKTDLKEPAIGTSSVFHWMRRIPANQGGLLSNGLYGEGWNGSNPLAMSKDGGLNRESPFSAIMNLDLKYKPVEWLTANLVYSPKFNMGHNKKFSEIIQTYLWDGSKSYVTPTKNSLTESYTTNWYNNLRAVLTFDKTFALDHQLTVLGGFQQEDQIDHSLSAYREVFLLSQYQEINAGNRENELTGGTSSHWALRSLFGRINYSYQGKYLLEANARYDGSSRFASGNKYAFFPSFSAGWRISQEPFMRNTASVVTDMKIRASWGRLGNQNIGLYPFAVFVDLGKNNYAFDNKIVTGAALTEMANPEIKWETTTVSDIGLDLSLWSKFNLTADYYYRKTTDILLQLDIPLMLGLVAPYQNAGVVENRGWDLSLGYRDQHGDFRYQISVNLSDAKNKVLDMKGVMRNGLQVNHEGYPINSLYGYEAEGIFQSEEEISKHATPFENVAPGDIKYKDQNNDGKIDNQDLIIMGSHLPRYTYSSSIDLAYKGIDFSVFLQGVAKQDGYLYGQGIMPFYEGGTVQEQHKDRWTPTNTNAAFPRFAFNETNNIQHSTFWLKSAAYLRVKNVQLGYTIPISLAKQNYIKNIRIFASGQNLLTLDKFWQGYDPEGPVGNGSWYPQMKVYTIGLNVKL